MEQIIKDLKNKSVDKIKKLLEENNNDITGNNLESIGKLLDIHKDIANIEYWKEKEANNMYGTYYGRNPGHGSYGNYGNDGYGDYRDYNGDAYGRRGYDMRYKGHEYLDNMYRDYGRYEEGRQRYGANEDTKRSLEYMLRSMENFARMLKEDAKSQEEVEMIRQTAQRIAQM